MNGRLAVGALAFGLFLTGAAPSALPAPATVVLLVRHGEKAPGTVDVPLADAGDARARALAEVGKGAGVQMILTTQYRRTQQTAATLATALSITAEVVGVQGDVSQHAVSVAAAIKSRHSGRTVLVVGHSNTIPSIVAALGGTRYPDLCDEEYDALFIVVIDAEGAARTVRTRYGAPSPLGDGCARMR